MENNTFLDFLKTKTSELVEFGKKIHCINPEHQDKNASMQIYENNAYCFSCGYNVTLTKVERLSTKEYLQKEVIEKSEENIEDWAKERGYDKTILKEIGVRRFTLETHNHLISRYGVEKLKEAELLNASNQPKYYDRIIIPYNKVYFSARSLDRKSKYKNLFPKGDSKKNYVLNEGYSEIVFFEGETDTISAYHMPCFKDKTLIGLGGIQSEAKPETISKRIIQTIKELNQEVKKIYLCFDNDSSGQSFTKSAIKSLQKKYDLYLIKIPEQYKDIDELHFKEQEKSFELLKIEKNQIIDENNLLSVDEQKNIDEKLQDPKLITLIWKELDKYHKEDHNAKLGVFVIGLSGFLPNSSDHTSGALKGDSASGKDNCIKTALRHIPDKESFFLTRGTQSALEEKSQEVKIIGFSEINADREDGANKELTEFFKQLSEGGVKVIKRDKITNEVVTISTEQKTLLYSTTEAKSDDELQTRYVVIPIKSNIDKNKIVVSSTLKNISSPEEYFKINQNNNWVKNAIASLDSSLDVIIPYATYLEKPMQKEGEKETFFFDLSKERIKRDVKRLLSLTKTITWLYQKQREVIEYQGHKILLSEPQDFKIAFYVFMNFFDLTYLGLDHRIIKVFETIKELEGQHSKEIAEAGYNSILYSSWVVRQLLQKECGIGSVATIKKYLKELKDHQLIETYYDSSNSKAHYLVKSYNSGYQTGYQKGIREYQLIAFDTLLTGYLTALERDYGKEISDKTSLRWSKFNNIYGKECCIFETFDPHQLTPSILSADTNPKKASAKDKIASFLSKQKKSVKKDLLIDNLTYQGYAKEEIDLAISKGIESGEITQSRDGELS